MAWTTPGTATAGSVLTAAFWNTQVRDNLAELGNLADGTAWESWTPSSRTGVTIGNGTETSRYVKVGRTVMFSYLFSLGSTSAITGDFTFRLPFDIAREQSCNAHLTDFATGTFSGIGLLANNLCYVRAINAAGTYGNTQALSATVPFTWGTSDYIVVAGLYEASS